MSLQNLSVKELKAKAKQKQSKLCPSYSKMKKTELIHYLQGSAPTKSTWSPVKYEPSNLSNIEFAPRKNPTHESPFFVQRKKLKRSVRKGPKKTKKLSSGPYDLEKMYKQDEGKYKQYKVHKKKSKNLSSMKVVELRKKLKSLGLNTKGKKDVLAKRLEMQGYGTRTVSTANSESVKRMGHRVPPGRAEATAGAIAARKRAMTRLK